MSASAGQRKRVCVFTGAAGRLGTAFCRRFADRYHIAAVYRRRPPTVPTQFQKVIDPLDPDARLPENEHPVFAIRADLSDDRDISRVVELVLARFERVDILVNAAVECTFARMLDSDRLVQSAGSQFNLNVVVPLKLSATFAREFWQGRAEENLSENRNIVNVSSIAAVNVYPNRGQSIYGAAKAAMNQLTRHMAYEFGAIGLRTNALAPNTFPTIVPLEDVVQSLGASMPVVTTARSSSSIEPASTSFEPATAPAMEELP